MHIFSQFVEFSINILFHYPSAFNSVLKILFVLTNVAILTLLFRVDDNLAKLLENYEYIHLQSSVVHQPYRQCC